MITTLLDNPAIAVQLAELFRYDTDPMSLDVPVGEDGQLAQPALQLLAALLRAPDPLPQAVRRDRDQGPQ